MVYSPNKYRETEGVKVRRLGIDLSEARLKAIAFELGITKVYSAMTQAEKAQLRYHAIMTQTTKAQGDMARTLEAPSNQLRILQAAASQAARAIGNVFIPILNALLPIGIAVVNVIRMIASAFASLLGFAMPTVDYSGIDGAADAAGKLNENLGGAGGSAKELQKVLMGFDEINKIPDASGGGGGGGGGGALDGFDFELLEYDFLGDAVNTRVNEIMQKLAPVLDFVKNNASDILKIAEAVGVAFLEWKVASKFLPDLRTGKNIVNAIKSTLLALTISAITITLGFEFSKDFLESSSDGDLKLGSLIANGITTALGSNISGLIVKQMTGSSTYGYYAQGITLGIELLSSAVLQFKDVVDGGGWDKDNLLQGITNVLMAAGFGFKIAGWKGALIAAGIDIAVETTAAIVGLTLKRSLKATGELYTGVFREKSEIESFIKKQMKFDVDAQISAVKATIELTDQAKKNLEDEIQKFTGNIQLLKLGVATEETIEDLKSQLSDTGGILSRLQEYLGYQENQLKAIITFAAPASANGSDNFAASLFDANTQFNTSLQSSVSLLGTTLANLLEKKVTEGLTANEASIANSLAESISRINMMVGEQNIATDFFKSANSIKWSDLDDASFVAALKEMSGAYDQAKSSLMEFSEAQKTEAQTRLWYAEQAVMPELNKLYEDAMNSGNAEAAALYNAEIEALSSAISNLKTQIDNWDVDSSVFNFGKMLLEGLPEGAAEEIKSRMDSMLKSYEDSLANAKNTVAKAALEREYEALTDAYYSMFGNSVSASVPSVLSEGLFGSVTSGGGGGGSPIVAQAQEAGKQVADAFVGAIDDGMKQVNVLGDENTFSGLRTQLVATGDDARGITEAIHEIPTNYAINLSIPSYSTIISRINNIASRVKSITSGAVNIKVKAGVDSGSKQFLLQLAQVSPTSTLAGQLMELIELSAFAKGGFPKHGDLFIANENGPELVGRIGNKTAVANEDQIGDTILSYMEQAEGGGGGSMDEERFASALVRAMKNAGLGALRIDGKDIVRSINRETQRTGHTPLTIK